MPVYVKRALWLVVILTVFFCSGCNFRLQTEEELAKKFSAIAFYSADPYGLLAREIKNVLIDHHIKLIEPDSDNIVPLLRIISSKLNKDTVSIYQDGKAAEYQLTLEVNVEVIIKKQAIYPISTKVFRSFFDNPAAVLAKNTEQTLIAQEMYKQAASQLIRQLAAIMTKQNINDQD